MSIINNAGNWLQSWMRGNDAAIKSPKYRETLANNLVELSKKVENPDTDLDALRNTVLQAGRDSNTLRHEADQVYLNTLGAPSKLEAAGIAKDQNLKYQSGLLDAQARSDMARTQQKGDILRGFQQGNIDYGNRVIDSSGAQFGDYLNFRREQANADRDAANKYAWLDPVRSLIGTGLAIAGLMKG